MSAATVSSIANATGRRQASRHAAPHRKNAAQQNPRSDSPYQERTSQKDNPTQALIKQAVDYLIRQLEAGQSDMLAAYLRTMARFHNYSFGNILQIARQRPTATHVAGYGKWKELGRFVKKGEKGIQILAPVSLSGRARDPPSCDFVRPFSWFRFDASHVSFPDKSGSRVLRGSTGSNIQCPVS